MGKSIAAGHKQITLVVDKIDCQACVNVIERNLGQVDGIDAVNANLADSSVNIRFSPQKIDLATIKEKLDDINYPVKTRKSRLNVEGMHCASCVSRLEKGLSELEGVTKVMVNLAEQTATVEYIETVTDLKIILKRIEDIGYKAFPGNTHEREIAEDRDHNKILRRNFKIALPLAILILFISHLDLFGISPLKQSSAFYILLALAIPVQFYCGRQFYAGFWKSLRIFSANMDTLVAVGTSAAFAYSLIATFYPSLLAGSNQSIAVYYDTAAVIITLILLGRILESRARTATAYEVEKLVRLEAGTATVERDGKEKEINSSDVKHGEIVIIKPGGKLPVDGIVTEGYSSVDESMLTGEPLPREVKEGDKVFAGSINQSGSFRFRVLAVESETVLGRIVESVRHIISGKAPIQRLADRVAAVFVPVVILIAVVAFFLWLFLPSEINIAFAMMIFIAVLIVACPCALGLATPTAIMVGSARAAREGILIKSVEILEQVRKIDVVVFDKTGTLSIGRPHVDRFINLGSRDERELIKYAVSLEKASEHPLAEAVISYGRARDVEPEKLQGFESLPGLGLKGEINGTKVLLGNLHFFRKEDIDLRININNNSKSKMEGHTVLYLAVNNRLEAMIAISDQIKPEAQDVVAELKKSGRSVWMLSGDNKAAAERMAEQLGIDHVMAEILPHEKADHIKSLMASGKHVAMVGDGINDSPALAAADIGIALGSGADVAVSFSDITLIGSNLNGVVRALRLSEMTLRTIKQNLMWAFGYNIVAIPIAAGVLYPAFGLLLSPVIASMAMAFSSIFVLGNSLRLRNLPL